MKTGLISVQCLVQCASQSFFVLRPVNDSVKVLLMLGFNLVCTAHTYICLTYIYEMNVHSKEAVGLFGLIFFF